ncbi:hypothetical protein [Salidesulfovibrio onnuriiensis]|uniref:hypothetical protein n=1 Tax=Salidesulfovibrio onnuriiensis TaxID=2583823 RepID=UPI0011CAA1F7|nr:hypothetical protein [Salidesulfovibrio onnuriiensis]
MTYINSAYANSAYYGTSLKTMGGEESSTDTTTKETDKTSEKTSEESSSSSSVKLTSDILKLLQTIPAAQQGYLSASDLQKQADKLEDEFDDQVLAELKELGVDTDTKFQLVYDSAKDAVVCSNGHPDKDKIEAYFKANPERKEQFKSLLCMRNLTQTATASMSPDLFKQQMTLASMSVWFGENMESSEFLGAQGIIYGAQSSYYKSINMTV